MDLNTLELIGAAFLSGVNVGKIAAECKKEDKEQEENKTEVQVEVKKISTEEMGKIFDELKNRIIGKEK